MYNRNVLLIADMDADGWRILLIWFAVINQRFSFSISIFANPEIDGNSVMKDKQTDDGD